jgi:carboxylesterase
MIGAFKPFAGDEHKAFRLNGGKPAALLVHGFPGTPAEMRPIAEALHHAGWSAEGLLLPGFGADIATLPQRKHRDWTAALQTALANLQREHSPVTLVGNSLGGALALEAAAVCEHSGAQPPDALVLFTPFWRVDHVLWQMLPLLKRIFPVFHPFRWIKPDFANPETRRGIANFMPDADVEDPQVQQAVRELTIPVAMFDELRSVGAAAYRFAPHVKVPALVLQGSQDTLTRPTNTRKLMARYAGAVEYREVPAAHDLVKSDSSAWSQVEAIVLQFAVQLEQKAYAHGA